MQEIINRILEGDFDYEGRALDFSCAKLELTLQVGTVCEGSFRVTAPAGRFTAGYITSSDFRMECLTSEFTGNDEEIQYRFHGESMEEGDVVKGAFFVVSNQGEYYLPFVVSVEHIVLNSSAGPIKNLFHFVNLAKSDWQEAVKLFYSPEFKRLFSGNDAHYLEAYRALSANVGLEQNVEEFLIHVNKKQKAEYRVEQERIHMNLAEPGNSCTVLETELSVIKSGWGYTRLQIECDGDFVFTEKEVLTDDDFLGNRCKLPVFVDTDLCHGGKNFGQIFLYNSYVFLAVPITVYSGAEGGRRDFTRERDVLRIMELYVDFRLKKITASLWLKETGKLVERLLALDGKDPAARLFQAQLLLTQERFHEAEWLLDHALELMSGSGEKDTLRAYYLYLTTLMNRDGKYVDKAAAQVRQIYRMDMSNWRVAWLLLYLSEEFNRSASHKWEFLERQFRYGCISPVLYTEALLLLNNNPTLLRRLGDFELQTLWFGAKRCALGSETTEQLLYLSGRVREFSSVLLKILISLHEIRADERVLREICAILIKGGKTGGACFPWYKAGVEAQIRITNLYEYFMMSLDLDAGERLPKMVLMYFSYQNNLDFERSAYLYDYVLQNRDELGELYASYRGRMEQFAWDQVKKGHVNRHLANLYKEFIAPDRVSGQAADSLARLAFACEVRTEDDRLKKLYVYQPFHLTPKQYVISEGKAWAAIYGSEYTIVFEDARGGRFTKSVDYTLEKLMHPGKYLGAVAPCVKDCIELDLYLYEAKKETGEPSAENTERKLRIVNSNAVALDIKREAYLKILRDYDEADLTRKLDDYLTRIPGDVLTMRQRSAVFRYMAFRGNCPLAYEWLERFGPYFADVKVLTRLLGALMEWKHMVEDPVLTASAVYVFQKGKYDGTILTYLSFYYKGLTKNMRDIWKAAMAYEVDCYRLSERILLQMLYSGSFVGEKMDIFRYYVSQGAKPEVEEAFLSQCAYDYFVKERMTEDNVFWEIKNMCMRNENVQLVCKLAYLKFYSQRGRDRDEEGERLTEAFLQEMQEENIHLEFLRSYKECEALRRDMLDKTIVEYHTRSGGRACIHYVILNENGESDEYRSEYMRDVCGGICFKEFVLFFGETLQYYITEEVDGQQQLTESANVQKSDGQRDEEDNKFHLINDILIGKTLIDYDTLDSLLEEYYSREYYNEQLFSLM